MKFEKKPRFEFFTDWENKWRWEKYGVTGRKEKISIRSFDSKKLAEKDAVGSGYEKK